MLPVNLEPYSGYTIQFFDAIASEMGFSYTVVQDPTAHTGAAVQSGAVDIGFAHLHESRSFTPDNAHKVTYSQPFYQSMSGAMVLRTKRKASRLFQLFDPFTPSLWAAIIASIGVAAALTIVLDVLAPSEDIDEPVLKRLSLERWVKSLYQMVATLLGGEDYEWVTWPARILRIGVLFMVLFVTSTYTAELAAFYTTPSFAIHGPTDLASLRHSTACIRSAASESRVRPYVQSTVVYTGELNEPNFDEDSNQFCYRQLQHKQESAFVDDINVLTAFKRRHCRDLHIVPSIHILPVELAFMMTTENADLAINISSAIAHFKSQPAYTTLLQESFGVGLSDECSALDTVENIESVGLESMHGMLVIYGSLAGLAVLIAIWQALKARAKNLQGGAGGEEDQEKGVCGPDHSVTDGEMLRMILKKIAKMEEKTTSHRQARQDKRCQAGQAGQASPGQAPQASPGQAPGQAGLDEETPSLGQAFVSSWQNACSQ
jgi:ABC-type amino acid transport substrate-binding protein